jgi:hypothetical protein
MQKEADEHETELRSPEGELSTVREDHAVPSQVRAPPLSSTAAQKILERHDTELNASPGSTALGVDHDVPL